MEGEQRLVLMPLGLFLLFIIFLVFRGHLPQTPGFRSARQILAVSFATRARTCILSDLNKFYIRRGGSTMAGSKAPGLFLFCVFFAGHLSQTSARSKQYLPVIFVRLAFIRQNFRKSWCRKLLAIEWHKNPFDENKNEGASKL